MGQVLLSTSPPQVLRHSCEVDKLKAKVKAKPCYMPRTVDQAILDLEGWLEAMSGGWGLQYLPISIKTLQMFPLQGKPSQYVPIKYLPYLYPNNFNIKKKLRGQ